MPPGLTRRTLLRHAAAGGAALAVQAELTGAAQAALRVQTRRARPRSSMMTFGTELEYYRSDPAHLEARLAACRAAGYTTIQTYVPWNVHENSRGRLDFSGKTKPVIVHDHVDEYQIETPDQEIAAAGLPSRVIANTDLLGFVRACERHGFKLILRPGPFISDEWRNGGLPDWLLLAYPRQFQLGPHGTALEPGFPFSPPAGIVVGGGPLYYFAGPSYASEDYLREARRWMTEFAREVAPMLSTRGGPVVSLQVDDEICFYYRFGPFEVDYHPSMVRRFGSEPPTDWPPPGGPVAALRPALRWQRFKARQLGAFLREMASALRAGGANVPITHEEELQLMPPANLAQIASGVDRLLPEFYLSPGPWSQPTLELCAAAVRAAQRNQRDVYSCEMSASDVFIRHLLLGEGILGFLGFSYTEGIPDAAVGEMAVLGRTLRLAGSRLARAKRIADTAIVWCPEHLYAPYDSTRYGFQRDVRGLAERDVPALATLLIRAGLAFDLLDTDVAQSGDYRAYPTIWLAAADVLPRRAQHDLVSHVRGGGRLICWPAPPTLDENYAPCTVLRDQLFRERARSFRPADVQSVRVLGARVPVWRGVQTYALSRGARAVARTTDGAICGYSRRVGHGRAILLGCWPAADSVPGREGDVFEIQDVPQNGSADTARAARAPSRSADAARAARARQIVASAPTPPGAGKPRETIVFDYSNERRGGEVATGGTVAYWDGENVVPVKDINAGTGVPEPTTIPFRPITAGHLAMARKLHGHRPACAVSDHHAQARILRARAGGGATVSVINRYQDDIRLWLRVRHPGRGVRLPLAGKLLLPAGSALLLPLDYRLAHGVSVLQATVQLLDAVVKARRLRLVVSSPGGGEVLLGLPRRPRSAAVDGKRVAVTRRRPAGSHLAHVFRVAVPAGERELVLSWA